MKRLCIWAFVFLAFRGACLWLFPDGAWTPEETLRGTVALEFQRALHGEGLRLPFWCHQADAYLGGSLVTAGITAVGYGVFGVHLFTLKLTAILFALLAMLVAYGLLRQELGVRAADLFALMYTFAPPAFVFLGAVSMGYHTESVVFLAVLLALAIRLSREPAPRGFLFLGLAGGFAFWFSNLNFVPFAAALIAIPRASWPRRAKQLGALFGGVFLGGLPWIAQNLSTGFTAFHSLATSFDGSRRSAVAPPVGYAFGKFGHLLTSAMPLSSGFPPALAYVHLALLVLLAALALRRLAPEWRRFVLAYFVLFAALYTFSNFLINTKSGDLIQFRYLQQWNLLLFLLAACVPVRMRPAALVLVGLSLFGLARTPRTAPAGRILEYRPYSYADLSAKVMSSCYSRPEKLPELLAWIGAEPPERQLQMRFPFVHAYNYASVSKDPALVPVHDRFFAEGYGAHLAGGTASDRILAAALRFDEASRPYYWRGVASGLPDFRVPDELYENLPADWLAFHHSLQRNVRACLAGAKLEPETAEWDARGQGTAIVDCHGSEEIAAAMAEELSAGKTNAYRDALAWGMGWRIRMRHLPDPTLSLDRIRRLPGWARTGALKGAQDFERDIGLTGTEAMDLY